MKTALHHQFRFAAKIAALVIVGTCATVVATYAMPPRHTLLEQANLPGAKNAPVLISTADLHERGICTPDDFFTRFLNRPRPSASAAPTGSPFRILALLVKFSDHPSQVAPSFFDSLVFDSSGGSTVKKYFNEISNTQIDLATVNLPSAVGWTTLDSSYAYYVNGQYGTGLTYPRNSQGLVEALVDKVNPSVDFSNYDNDGNGFVDVLLVIHSGTGAEVSGNAADIWSHKWSLQTPRLKDGVYISTYTVQPEFWSTPGDMTIGVYSHELCHGFGLPDLYDTYSGNGDSRGLGRWCIMAYGCWNGPSNLGESPSHPSAWSRIHMGLATPVNVTSNTSAQTITPVESGGSIYRLWPGGAASGEYFLIENRRQTLYDSYLPGQGLLIYHVDSIAKNNDSAWWPGQPASRHYMVALEQADGLWDLEHSSYNGDAADPFPGSGSKTSFNSLSTPNSDSYLGGATSVAVNNITSSGADIIADLVVGLAASVDPGTNSQPQSFTLAQNYPNPFNPSTIISFELSAVSDVTLEVFNCKGQLVRTLFSGRAQAGLNSVTWDGTDTHGRESATGVYFYRLTKDHSQELARKMVLVK
ncbi:MAG: M6 family metalloprotease domain-containing protein [candidate division Zixibacteria bacterium]|nr:M6 family metalloprotease domain-containing protein [candidate division Zixibacteria bacterium]